MSDKETTCTCCCSEKIQEFEKRRVQDIFSQLAKEHNAVNLGQAFPDWEPESILEDALRQHVHDTSHQYTRSYGDQRLVKEIAKFYKPIYNREIDPEKNIVVSNGGISCLCNTFLGVVSPGDEVILIEPFFDCYRPQIIMAGGKPVSVTLTPKNRVSKEDLLQRDLDHLEFTEQDEWVLDWDLLEKSMNEKTKAIILNSPHNPTGKIFTQKELERLAEIIKNFERVIVVFDQVYEAHCYGRYKPLDFPRFANLPGMWDRTISISSAGKLYSATGIRVGWAIGPEKFIKCISSFHQYNGFCLYGPVQSAVADVLEHSIKTPYFKEFNEHLKAGRTLLVKQLINAPINMNIYVCEGGCSVLLDIQDSEVPEKYYTGDEGQKYTKDWAFCMWLCKEKGVVALPCSAFYTKEYEHYGRHYVRIAFCKQIKTLIEVGIRLGTTHQVYVQIPKERKESMKLKKQQS